MNRIIIDFVSLLYLTVNGVDAADKPLKVFSFLQPPTEERHRSVRPLSDLLSTAHLQVMAHDDHLLDPSWFVTH